jgi:hypothetical protein
MIIELVSNKIAKAAKVVFLHDLEFLKCSMFFNSSRTLSSSGHVIRSIML